MQGRLTADNAGLETVGLGEDSNTSINLGNFAFIQSKNGLVDLSNVRNTTDGNLMPRSVVSYPL